MTLVAKVRGRRVEVAAIEGEPSRRQEQMQSTWQREVEHSPLEGSRLEWPAATNAAYSRALLSPSTRPSSIESRLPQLNANGGGIPVRCPCLVWWWRKEGPFHRPQSRIFGPTRERIWRGDLLDRLLDPSCSWAAAR